jgi:hypothetical protein
MIHTNNLPPVALFYKKIQCYIFQHQSWLIKEKLVVNSPCHNQHFNRLDYVPSLLPSLVVMMDASEKWGQSSSWGERIWHVNPPKIFRGTDTQPNLENFVQDDIMLCLSEAIGICCFSQIKQQMEIKLWRSLKHQN